MKRSPPLPPSPLVFVFFFFFGSNLNLSFFNFFVDKDFITKNRNLVNFEDLNKILNSKIFLYKDGQLQAAHIILDIL